MIKNDRGVTLISMVVAVLILGILAGVSITAGTSIIPQVNASKVFSNMTLVNAKVQTIYEEYQFYNNDENYLVKSDDYVYVIGTMGLNISREEIEMIAQKYGVTIEEVSNWEWYKWDSGILKSQGLDKQMLGNNECFFVNYEYGEIIFSEKISDDKDGEYHSFTGIKNILENS